MKLHILGKPTLETKSNFQCSPKEIKGIECTPPPHQAYLRDSQSRKFHINLVWPLNQIYLNAICTYRLLSFSLPLSNDSFVAPLWASCPIKWIRLPVAFVLLAFALPSKILSFHDATCIIYMHHYTWYAMHLSALPISLIILALGIIRGLCSNSLLCHQLFPIAAVAARTLWEVTCHKPHLGLLAELCSANPKSSSLLSQHLAVTSW